MNAQQIREGIKIGVCYSGGGHAGGSLSVADILASLYGTVMRYDPKNPDWEKRDRLVLSKGHSGLGLYAALAAAGFFPMEDLKFFARQKGHLANHPDAHNTPGVEVSTGSLGHGFPLCVGIATAGELKGEDYFTYCILGDSECHEGTNWEAAMFAGDRKLKRLVVVVDRNHLGNDGSMEKTVELDPLDEKFKSFGFKTYTVDGHDVDQMNELFLAIRKEAQGPYAIIANTEKGRGLKTGIAGTGASHYLKGTKEELEKMFAFQ